MRAASNSTVNFSKSSALASAAAAERVASGQLTAADYYDRGVSFYGTGDYDTAIACFNDAIQLDQNMAMAYTYRGIAYRKKGDNDRAIADYTQVIRLNVPAVYEIWKIAEFSHCFRL
jgi:tetratricopeptide (TPR) repeat protein